MIKELLSTALIAVSLNNTPKRVMDTSNYPAPYVIALTYDGFSGAREFGARFLYGNEEVSLTWEYNSGTGQYTTSTGEKDIGDGQGSDYVKGEAYYGVSNSVYSFTFYLNFGLDIRSYQNAYSYLTALNGTSGYEGGFTSWTATNTGLDDEYDDGDYYVLTFAYQLSFNGSNLNQGDTFYYSLGDYSPAVTHSVSFLLNHCTTTTAYPVVVVEGQSFTAKFTAMSGYAFKGDNVAEYFDYPQGALNPVYQVSDIVGDFGSYWRSVTITAVVWADCTLTINPAPLDEGALQDAYERGYADAKTTYENTNQFAWLKSIWTGMAAFFSIEILPNISLGFLAFAPLLVVAIIAIVRILKHD